MERKLNKRPKSIAQALSMGQVIRYCNKLDSKWNERYEFYIKYFKPIPYGNNNSWSLTGEWFECSERYFFSFVKKHRNFKA